MIIFLAQIKRKPIGLEINEGRNWVANHQGSNRVEMKKSKNLKKKEKWIKS